MNTATFTATTVNPNVLTPHSYLVDMGYYNKSDAFFSAAVKYFNHYDAPVIDKDMHILTHSAFVEAAIANGVEEMKVYQVDLSDLDVRRLIATMHKYHRKDLIASYKTIKYYEDYLKCNKDGIALAASLKGDINDQIAVLMQTSSPTIKRLKRVGDYNLHMLGLIEQSEKSFKEVLYEIKLKGMEENTNRRAALAAETAAEQQTTNTHETAGEVDSENNVEEYYQEPSCHPEENEEGETATDQQEPCGSITTSTITKAACDFTKGDMSIAGIGELAIGTTGDIPYLTINGKKIDGCVYETIVNRDSEANGVVQSFIFRQPTKDGICIQLTIENFKKAA